MTKTSKLLIAIGLFVVVAVVAVYFLVIRPGGEGAEPTTTAVAEAPAAEPAAPAGEAQPEAAPTAPEVAAEAAPSAPAAEPLTGSREPFRTDPFKPFPMKIFPPPPPPPLWGGLISAPVSVAKLSPVEPKLRVGAPTRRVAGLLWDGRVWALYESVTPKGAVVSSVVKPGDIVEGGMVRAITDEGLLLDVEGEAEPVVVPLLRGAPRPATPVGTGVTPGPTGRPGLPGTTPVSGTTYRTGGPPGVPAL